MEIKKINLDGTEYEVGGVAKLVATLQFDWDNAAFEGNIGLKENTIYLGTIEAGNFNTFITIPNTTSSLIEILNNIGYSYKCSPSLFSENEFFAIEFIYEDDNVFVGLDDEEMGAFSPFELKLYELPITLGGKE